MARKCFRPLDDVSNRWRWRLEGRWYLGFEHESKIVTKTYMETQNGLTWREF